MHTLIYTNQRVEHNILEILYRKSNNYKIIHFKVKRPIQAKVKQLVQYLLYIHALNIQTFSMHLSQGTIVYTLI